MKDKKKGQFSQMTCNLSAHCMHKSGEPHSLSKPEEVQNFMQKTKRKVSFWEVLRDLACTLKRGKLTFCW